MSEMVVFSKIGTLYLNGKPQKVGVAYNGEQISFGPAERGKGIQWIKSGQLLIADRCVCTDISWTQLDEQGLVFGIIVQISGKYYLCRCPKVGVEGGPPTNEWDTAIRTMGADNSIWHWEEMWFWGQEHPPQLPGYGMLRGYSSASYFGYNAIQFKTSYVGWRPVLEYMGDAPNNPYDLVNKDIRLYGPGGVNISGRLMGVDDYDLALFTSSPLPGNCTWAEQKGDSMIVDRGSVLWLGEV